MPSKSAAQARLMAAVAHGWHKPGRGGPSVAVAKEFNQADKGHHFAGGGKVDATRRGFLKGLGALGVVAGAGKLIKPLEQIKPLDQAKPALPPIQDFFDKYDAVNMHASNLDNIGYMHNLQRYKEANINSLLAEGYRPESVDAVINHRGDFPFETDIWHRDRVTSELGGPVESQDYQGAGMKAMRERAFAGTPYEPYHRAMEDLTENANRMHRKYIDHQDALLEGNDLGVFDAPEDEALMAKLKADADSSMVQHMQTRDKYAQMFGQDFVDKSVGRTFEQIPPYADIVDMPELLADKIHKHIGPDAAQLHLDLHNNDYQEHIRELESDRFMHKYVEEPDFAAGGPVGFAGGGAVDGPSEAEKEWQKRSDKAAMNRRRLATAFLSQVGSQKEDGTFGVGIPGMAYNAASLPVLGEMATLGAWHAPKWAHDAADKASNISDAAHRYMGVTDPSTLSDHFLESLGVMGGQVPIVGQEGKLAQLLAKYGMGVKKMGGATGALAEWFGPTINARDPLNYIKGATAGTAIPYAVDALTTPGYEGMPTVPRFAGGGKVDTLQKIAAFVDKLKRDRIEEKLSKWLRLNPGADTAVAPPAPLPSALSWKANTPLQLATSFARPNVTSDIRDLMSSGPYPGTVYQTAPTIPKGGYNARALMSRLDNADALTRERGQKAIDLADPRIRSLMTPQMVGHLANSIPGTDIGIITPKQFIGMAKPASVDADYADSVLRKEVLEKLQQLKAEGITHPPKLLSAMNTTQDRPQIVGHNGRHRMMALQEFANADDVGVPTLVRPYVNNRNYRDALTYPGENGGTQWTDDRLGFDPAITHRRLSIATDLPNEVFNNEVGDDFAKYTPTLKSLLMKYKGRVPFFPQGGSFAPDWMTEEHGPYTFQRDPVIYDGPAFKKGGRV